MCIRDRASYDFQTKMELGQKVIVGVNKFVEPERNDTEILRIDDSIRALQTAKLVKLRAERNADEVNKTLKALKEATVDGKNIMPVSYTHLDVYKRQLYQSGFAAVFFSQRT